MQGCRVGVGSATLDGVWLSSGPIRTGIRTFGQGGIFAVGNAAAEAHPIVAEGISIAIQSAALLCEQLMAHPELRPDEAGSARVLKGIREDYAQAWRNNFSRRLFVAAAFAHIFMRPVSTRIAAALLERSHGSSPRARAGPAKRSRCAARVRSTGPVVQHFRDRIECPPMAFNQLEETAR